MLDRVEDETRAVAKIRRAHHDPRPVALQVVERRAVEQNLVVHVCGQLGTAPTSGTERGPANRIEGPPNKLALHVALEEARFVDVEKLVAVQAERQRGKAPARDPVITSIVSSTRTLRPLLVVFSISRKVSSTP
jgi:hypothetical protein